VIRLIEVNIRDPEIMLKITRDIVKKFDVLKNIKIIVVISWPQPLEKDFDPPR
jgi:hypothetical protein